MPYIPTDQSYNAALRLVKAWSEQMRTLELGTDYPYHLENYAHYDAETRKALLQGSKKGAVGAPRILFERLMKRQLPQYGHIVNMSEAQDHDDPRTFAFGYRLFKFCLEELNAEPATCVMVMESFARYPQKEQRRLAPELPDSVGGIGYLLDEHRDWLMLFHCNGHLQFVTLKLEYQDL